MSELSWIIGHVLGIWEWLGIVGKTPHIVIGIRIIRDLLWAPEWWAQHVGPEFVKPMLVHQGMAECLRTDKSVSGVSVSVVKIRSLKSRKKEWVFPGILYEYYMCCTICVYLLIIPWWVLLAINPLLRCILQVTWFTSQKNIFISLLVVVFGLLSSLRKFQGFEFCDRNWTDLCHIIKSWGFPGVSVGKESTCNGGGADFGSMPGFKKILLEEGMTTHCNILSWRIPCTEEPGRL